jgi:hypothetical protein
MLTDLEALDNGLKKGLASGFLGMSVSCLRYYAGWADKVGLDGFSWMLVVLTALILSICLDPRKSDDGRTGLHELH